jgi:uncharacterized membrane protein
MSNAYRDAGRVSASKRLTEAPEIHQVNLSAPYDWLAEGWRDLRAAPAISLAYGAVYSVLAYAIAYLLTRMQALPLLLPLAGGFLLLAPLLAVGLYEISRRRELGEPVRIGDVLAAGRGSRAQLAYLGVALLLLYFFWIRVALLLFMLFFGQADFPPFDDFVQTLFVTAHGQGLLLVGTAVGALFAFAAFAISAISVPMIFDRKTDAVTAMISSIKAVRHNLQPMALWAVLIVALTGLGFATLFAGLAITFPLIGYATWHAHKALAGRP